MIKKAFLTSILRKLVRFEFHIIKAILSKVLGLRSNIFLWKNFLEDPKNQVENFSTRFVILGFWRTHRKFLNRWARKKILVHRWTHKKKLLNENNSFVKYINNSLNENNSFVEYMNNLLNQNNYFVEYINNSLNDNNYFAECVNNSLN